MLSRGDGSSLRSIAAPPTQHPSTVGMLGCQGVGPTWLRRSTNGPAWRPGSSEVAAVPEVAPKEVMRQAIPWKISMVTPEVSLEL